jgi:hypothetical protein
MNTYGEIRHADGTPLAGGGAREPLAAFGGTAQEAVDALAAEIESQGGLGTVDLNRTPGRLAVYAVNADGTPHQSGAASDPLRRPRRRTPGRSAQYYRPWMGGREDVRSSR